jgi:hypothetical protein
MVHGPEHTTKTEEELYQKAGSSPVTCARPGLRAEGRLCQAARHARSSLSGRASPTAAECNPVSPAPERLPMGACPAPTRLALRSLSVPLSACWDLLSVVLHPLSSNEPSPMPGEAPYYRITPNTIASLCPYRPSSQPHSCFNENTSSQRTLGPTLLLFHLVQVSHANTSPRLAVLPSSHALGSSLSCSEMS